MSSFDGGENKNQGNFDTSNILKRHARNATYMGVPNTAIGKQDADRRVLSPEPPRVAL